METSRLYKGHVTRYDPIKHFGFIETEETNTYFFFYDKDEAKKLKKEGKIKAIHRFCSGDEVEFKLRQSTKESEKQEAFDVAFIRNERREILLSEALINPNLLGYLKLVDGKDFFVKHKTTYVYVPVQISDWEEDLQQVYHNRIDKLVEFRLNKTKRIDKLVAVLTDRKFSSEYKKFLDYYTKGLPILAVITGANQSGYFAKIIINNSDSFIPIPKNYSQVEAESFFRFKKGDIVSVKIRHIGKTKNLLLDMTN